jgi:hypothetical protein
MQASRPGGRGAETAFSPRGDFVSEAGVREFVPGRRSPEIGRSAGRWSPPTLGVILYRVEGEAAGDARTFSGEKDAMSLAAAKRISTSGGWRPAPVARGENQRGARRQDLGAGAQSEGEPEMKIFLDTANVAQIRRLARGACSTGITNLTLI